MALLFSPAASAPAPDYGLGEWTGNQFSSKSSLFFHQITLQTTHPLLTGSGRAGRISLTAAAGGSVTFGNNELTRKAGLLPSFTSLYRVSDNLWLGGVASGFMAGDDIVMLTGYGAAVVPSNDAHDGAPWSIEIDRRALEGANDFSLKTVRVGFSRWINFREALLLYGVGSTFYDVIVHTTFRGEETSFRKRMEGQVNTIQAGAELAFGGFIGGVRLKLSGQAGSVILTLGTRID